MARKTMMMIELEECLQAFSLDVDEAIGGARRLLGLYGRLAWFAGLGGSADYSEDGLRGALGLCEEILRGGLPSDAAFGAGALCDVMRQVLGIIGRYPVNGVVYHYILEGAYFAEVPLSDVVLMDALHLERTTFYSRKREAVMLFAMLIYTRFLPQLHQALL